MKDLFEVGFPVFPIPKKYFLCNVDQENQVITDLKKYVLGKPWKDVTLKDWRMSEPSLGVVRNYITPEAYIYYIPSVLLGIFEDIRFLEIAIEAILPYNHNHVPKGKWWATFYIILSQTQKQCIVKFIKYIEQNYWDNIGISNQSDLFDANNIWI